MRVKLTALTLLLLPFLGATVAIADEGDRESVIPPAEVGTMIDPHAQDPIDLSKIEISTLTPADKFVNATTPLVAALGLGSVALVIYTLAQGAKESQPD
ncbi:MAG: hypothetical protein RL450_387 [Actinomycetota bacterium]